MLIRDAQKKGNASGIAYSLTDSLKLATSLYPEIFSLSQDTIFADELAIMTNTLLDSGMLAQQAVLPYKQRILSTAAARLDMVLKDTTAEWWKYSDWIELTGKFNDAASNDLLQQFLKVEPLTLKRSAIIALARNNQTVDKGSLEKVAADRYYRNLLYDDLKALKKENLFPATYASQKALAEGDIYQILNEDYEIKDIVWVGEKIVDFMGKKQKFHLFKVSVEGEEGIESYLAIAGPYALGRQELISYADASGLYSDEPFNKNKIDNHLAAYLQHTAEYLKEEGKAK